MKRKPIDICDDYNRACTTAKPLTAEDRRRGIVAFKYTIQLKDENKTQRETIRAEHLEIGDTCMCLDTGFDAEVLRIEPIKDGDIES